MSPRPRNAPSTTGRPSGRGRGNNPSSKSMSPRPRNGPSTTGNPSGRGRGNNSSRKR